MCEPISRAETTTIIRRGLQLSHASALSILLASGSVFSAEGGYSNYIPGAYGDFGMALAPPDGWTLRNDIYYYTADTDETVRSGRVEAGLELDMLMNMTLSLIHI